MSFSVRINSSTTASISDLQNNKENNIEVRAKCYLLPTDLKFIKSACSRVTFDHNLSGWTISIGYQMVDIDPCVSCDSLISVLWYKVQLIGIWDRVS